ncbi:hypothetical protein RZS08_12955, partial [Arthrospira platensis SPKY1]|nr:hypothetical protein [Arthrospira platensis SPKY1]
MILAHGPGLDEPLARQAQGAPAPAAVDSIQHRESGGGAGVLDVTQQIALGARGRSQLQQHHPGAPIAASGLVPGRNPPHGGLGQHRQVGAGRGQPHQAGDRGGRRGRAVPLRAQEHLQGLGLTVLDR